MTVFMVKWEENGPLHQKFPLLTLSTSSQSTSIVHLRTFMHAFMLYSLPILALCMDTTATWFLAMERAPPIKIHGLMIPPLLPS